MFVEILLFWSGIFSFFLKITLPVGKNLKRIFANIRLRIFLNEYRIFANIREYSNIRFRYNCSERTSEMSRKSPGLVCERLFIFPNPGHTVAQIAKFCGGSFSLFFSRLFQKEIGKWKCSDSDCTTTDIMHHIDSHTKVAQFPPASSSRISFPFLLSRDSL